jgi:hypothetical protein
VIPNEALDSCRDLLVALLEFANGDPEPRRHATYVYHCYLHALRAGDSATRRTLRWRRFINALKEHLRYGAGVENESAAYLRTIVIENADLLAVLAV